MKQKTVYIVADQLYYDCETEFNIIGVYPTKKKAQQAMAKVARKRFNSDYKDEYEDYSLDIRSDCANILDGEDAWVVHYDIYTRVMKF